MSGKSQTSREHAPRPEEKEGNSEDNGRSSRFCGRSRPRGGDQHWGTGPRDDPSRAAGCPSECWSDVRAL